MKFVKKKKILIIASIIITLVASLTACGNTETVDKEVKKSLNLLTKPEIVESGNIESAWTHDSMAYSLLFSNFFIENAETGALKPDLARAYTISEDGLTYDFLLKSDLLWSDGEALDMDDVLFSFHNILLAFDTNPIFLTAFGEIVGADEFLSGEAETISGLFADYEKNTITISLKKPVVTFMKVMAQFAILPEHVLNAYDMKDTKGQVEFWRYPVCSGMYKIDNYVLGESVEFTINENYHGVPPKIKSVILSPNFTPEEVDFYEANDISEILDYRSVINKEEYITNTLFYRYFVFKLIKDGVTDPVMSDVRVRQAIVNALDREALLKDIYYNAGTIIKTESWVLDREENAKDFSHNIELSKQLLDEAGYDFDRPLVILSYYSDDTSIRFMEMVASQLEEVGFNVEIIMGAHLYEGYAYDVALKGLSAFDVTEWYNEYTASHQLQTGVFGGEPMFDDLIERLISTTNLEDKEQVLSEMRTRGDELLYKFPLFTLDFMAYVNKDTLEVPEDVVFGNPRYGYDIGYENWILKK